MTSLSAQINDCPMPFVLLRVANRQAGDTQGCIRPLALCISCFFACVATPHATADGSKVLFAVWRTQPFFLVAHNFPQGGFRVASNVASWLVRYR